MNDDTMFRVGLKIATSGFSTEYSTTDLTCVEINLDLLGIVIVLFIYSSEILNARYDFCKRKMKVKKSYYFF